MQERLQALSKSVNQSRGPGWLLMMIESMMSEWGWSLEKAVFEGPLTACLALWPALLHRHGCEVHGTHVDKARQQAKQAMREHISQHFTVREATAKEIADFARGSWRK